MAAPPQTRKSRRQARFARFDRVLEWGLFVLPGLCGSLTWRDGDTETMELALLCWYGAAAGALNLLFRYYGTTPRDR